MTIATDYSPTPRQSDIILALSAMHHKKRIDLLEMVIAVDGAAFLADLLSHVVGMANSVAENCREWIELTEIIERGVHPHTAEKINLPTMEGAALGAKIAFRVAQTGLCGGCAARLGSVANQCEPTVIDVDYCEDKGGFLCHVDGLDDRGELTQPCIGAVRLMAVKRAVGEIA